MRTLKQDRSLYPLVYLFILVISVSCQDTGVGTDKDKTNVNNNEQTVITYTDQEKLKKNFAEVLAKALKDSYPLRKLIKKEALKKFNKDYDVLYHMVKNKKLSDGQTVHNFLGKYFENESNLNKIENTFPLLTIFVPTLPEDTFSAKSWNVSTDVPKTAVVFTDKNQIPIFDSEGTERVLTAEQIPAFPVLVIKENERVVVNNPNKNKDKNSRMGKTFYTSEEKYHFSFIDNYFDNSSQQNETRSIQSKTWWEDPIPLDSKKKRAFNLDIDWQRDYIYYNLEPGQERGPLDDSYKEYITSIKFVDATGLYQISNSTNEPDPNSPSSWSDGVFEFHVNVLINGKNGTGQNILKVFAADGSDLFDITYERNGSYYTISSVEPIEFWPYKLEIAPWDLNNYGVAWKFSFEEFDASQTITSTQSSTSKFATNFGFDIGFGDVVKIGFNFGSSTNETRTQTYSVQTSIESDQLGETIVNFGDPVITDRRSVQGFLTRSNEYSTGTLLISLEPMTNDNPHWDYLENSSYSPINN